jgi:acyl-CoA thioesterase FadM
MKDISTQACPAFADQSILGEQSNNIANDMQTSVNVLIQSSDQYQLHAYGTFIHVYVDKKSRRPQSLPDKLRNAASKIFVKI